MYGGANNLGWTTACTAQMYPGNSADYCECAIKFCSWDYCVLPRCFLVGWPCAGCLPAHPAHPSCRSCPHGAALCGYIGGSRFSWNGVQSSNPAAVGWDIMWVALACSWHVACLCCVLGRRRRPASHPTRRRWLTLLPCAPITLQLHASRARVSSQRRRQRSGWRQWFNGGRVSAGTICRPWMDPARITCDGQDWSRCSAQSLHLHKPAAACG